VYERLWAEALRLVWPRAERVERSGAGRYVKGDIRNTPPLHWSIKSGYAIDWPGALRDAAREVETRPELKDYTPVAGITLRTKPGRPGGNYVLMRREDFIELLAEYANFLPVDEYSILVESVR